MEKKISGFDRYFKITERGSSISKELLGGLTIFLAMIYILPVNADMLSKTGISFGGVFAATAISAAIATLVMGLVAKYPIALASGMGVNAFFTFTVVFGLGFNAYEAFAAVFVSGILFLLISVLKIREKVINAIPKNLKVAIGAGIGFFIGFIGLKNSGVIVANGSTAVALGDLSNPTVLLGLVGIILVLVIHSLNIKISKYAVIISMFVIGAIGVILGVCGVNGMPQLSNDNLGNVSDVKDLFGKCFTALPSLLANPKAYPAIFALLFVDFFDTAGTLVAVGHDAGLVNEKGELVDGNKAFLADAIGTVVGAIVGTSTVTSFVESTTGVKQGARTGLSACVVGVLFLLSLLIYPIFGFVSSIPSQQVIVVGSEVITYDIFYSPVTSLALVFVGALMMSGLKELDFKDSIATISAFITIIMMTLCYSISEGISFGFITFTLLMLASKRGKEVSVPMYVISGLFLVFYLVKFIWLV